MLEYNGYFINCLYDTVKRTFKAFIISKGVKRFLLHATPALETERAALNAARSFINSVQ